MGKELISPLVGGDKNGFSIGTKMNSTIMRSLINGNPPLAIPLQDTTGREAKSVSESRGDNRYRGIDLIQEGLTAGTLASMVRRLENKCLERFSLGKKIGFRIFFNVPCKKDTYRSVSHSKHQRTIIYIPRVIGFHRQPTLRGYAWWMQDLQPHPMK